MEVSSDYLDEILIHFMGEKNSMSLEEIIEKFKDYVNERPMLKNTK